jgi:hypothetical protein
MDVNEDYVDSENLSLESVNIEDPESPTAPQKRKGDIAHDVRPNPRFSDLFNSPASGAPIIIQLINAMLVPPLELHSQEKFHRQTYHTNRPSETRDNVDAAWETLHLPYFKQTKNPSTPANTSQ